MLTITKAQERGHVQNDWLDSWHTFSFGNYYNPARMHHRFLRVINQDIIAPASGFPQHPHRDMEIITYIIRGRLSHNDNTGAHQEIGPGEIQRMTAGSGIEHSEFNPSQSEETELLQIWIMPAQRGLKPGYEQRRYDSLPVENGLQLMVTPDGAGETVKINQDVKLFKGHWDTGDVRTISLDKQRHGWLQIVSGELQVNSKLHLSAGDGLAISDEGAIEIRATTPAEFLLFDLN